MKQSLQLKLSQHLTLTPQLQQSIRLLQLSTLELNQELDRFLMENPLLERTDIGSEPVPPPFDNTIAPRGETNAQETPGEWAESAIDSHNDTWDGTDNFSNFDDGANNNYGSREEGEERQGQQLPAVHPSLQDHLFVQLSLTQLSHRDKQLVVLLISHLDDDGYLTASLDEIFEALHQENNEAEPEELSIALKHLQNLDPPGVGARSLSECLELQLNAIPACILARN